MISLTLTVVPLVDGGNNTVSVLLISANWIGIPLHERIRIHTIPVLVNANLLTVELLLQPR